MINNIAKNIFSQKKTGAFFFIILIALLVLSGCQSTSPFYTGKQVAPEQVTPVFGEAEKDKWSTFDLTITYNFNNESNNFNIDGQIELSDHYRMNYNSLRRLELYLLFLDSNSQVVEATKIFNNRSEYLDDTLTFTGSLVIPKDSVAFSFAYEGTVMSGDRKRKSPTFFWHRPK
jgi:hypothetical protein